MLLAVDMGNTQTALGLFDGDDLVHSWRMPTDRTFTADEVHMRLEGYFRMSNLDLSQVKAIAFAGVVPELSREWHAVAARLTATAVVVGTQTAQATKLRVANPSEVGADRIANAVAAEAFYGAPAIVVDFGTATNIDVVDASGSYRGGCIAPGLMLSASALFEKAAKLSSIPIEVPPAPIGDTTEHALQSGLVLGAAAQAEGLVARIKAQLAREQDAEKIDCPVIATGGLGGVVGQATDVFDAVDVDLTLRGIWRIWQQAR